MTTLQLNFQNKIDIPYSFAFLDVVPESTLKELQDWANSVFSELNPNSASPNRYFRQLSELSVVPQIVYQIKTGIQQLLSDKDVVNDTIFTDFLSVNTISGAIHPHTDPNIEGYIHTRFNLIVQAPDSGGNPVYNGMEFPIKSGMLWRCEAGKYIHSSTPVIGLKKRINISFGFQIKP